MKQTRKKASVKRCLSQDDFNDIHQLFQELEHDKTLPSFGDFFMRCLMFDIGECVNLKKMYPTAYAKYSNWLAEHDMQNKGKDR